MAYVIAETCIAHSDPSCFENGGFPCVEACLADGIYGAPDDPQLYVNTDECIDCGVCYPACPVGAIFTDYEAPRAFESNQAHYRTGAAA